MKSLAFSLAAAVALAWSGLAAAADLPAIEKVEIRGRAFCVNGEPFFPIMAWLQDAKNFPAVRACGMNTVAGYWPKSSGTRDVSEYLPLAWQAGLYGVMPFDARLKGHAGLLAYIHGDEPDLPYKEGPARGEPRTAPGRTLEEYRAIKAQDPARPVLMTLTGYFHPHFNKWPKDQREALYGAYVRATDVVGFDIYPIYGWNRPDWIHLVHDATALLTAMAGPRPVYAWIETSRGGQYTGALEGQKEVTPRHIRAEVWMAVTGGATAVGYFTHVWKPSYDQFGVPEANRKALADVNAQLTRLAPAILGEACAGKTAATDPAAKVAALFRAHGGARYVFAVNYDERPAATRATFEVPGLADGAAVEVVDEDRTVRAAAGGFADAFDPLAVHIYRVAAAVAAEPPTAPAASETATDAKTGPDAKPAAEAEAGFVPLFPKDGVPEGWRTGYYSDVSRPAPKGAVWTVREGVLHGSEPRATWLFSEKTYGDFILECEFHLDASGNSGIGLRFPGAGDPAYTGLELQIVDAEYYAGFATTPAQFTGALYDAVAPKKQVYKPGEWNRYRITLRGSKVHVVLNGEVIQDVDLAEQTQPPAKGEPLAKRPRRGHIGFQELSRTGKHVQFRSVRIKVLDEP